jgi:dihydroorotase
MASRVGWTPFDGMEAKGWPMATIIRGAWSCATTR